MRRGVSAFLPKLASCLAPLAGLLLCGCVDGAIATAGANLASVTLIHRTLVDGVYSLVTGKDCSIVNLDRGEAWCRPPEPPPAQQPYCTRSLANVDCWASPENLGSPPPRTLAEGPTALTAEQEANRTAPWPQAGIGLR